MTQNNPNAFVPLAESTHNTYIMGASVLTPSIPLHANGILVQALTQNIRFTLTGTNPSASTGFQLKAGDPPLFIGLDRNITLKFFREASGAVLEYEYMGSEHERYV